MILKPTPINIERLDWSMADKSFFAEASDLPQPSRVYDDACDVGYTLYNPESGRSIVVAEAGEKRDQEGDLLFTVYAAVQPGAISVKLIVWND